MYYEDIFKALSLNKVRYVVVGAMAMNLHGVPRMTADLDLMLDLRPANLKKFLAAVTSIGYVPKLPLSVKDFLDPGKRRTWADTKNMVMFTLGNPTVPYQELDVFVDNPMDFDEVYKGRTTFTAGGIKIPVACVDHLISLKEKAGRRHDRSDIPILKKLRKMTE